MLNNFIGGGQVFLHKIRMFQQVFTRTVSVAFLLGVIASVTMYNTELKELDWESFYSYRKAMLADEFDGAINSLRMTIGKKPTYITYINVKTRSGIVKTNIDPRIVKDIYLFKKANRDGMSLGWEILIASGFFTSIIFCLIFLLWSKFGQSLKAEKTKDGANKILTAKEVRKALLKIGRASSLKIGDMPLVQDMETMNILVSGSIGSGKTNLMHNILPQIEERGEAAIIIDNTGEMIAKYYDPRRGDIIFNPFDSRGKDWDFWTDCSRQQDLEKFADILIGFNSRKNNKAASDFWEQSAQNVFVACANILKQYKQYSVQELYSTLTKSGVEELYTLLDGTDTAKYFTKDNAKAASSIIAVLMANVKSLKFLNDTDKGNGFSIKSYTKGVNEGKKSWLFLATDPSSRELTTPLNASILELFISHMRKTRTKPINKLWIVMDELPSLGKLPSISQLMAEGRKYGACVLAGVQSTSQLYHHYGDAESSTLIGLFKTKFAFASDDPRMGELYSKLCGRKITISQQKNTSFGANEFRDGVSYNERSEQSPLIPYEDFAKLSIGECYVILPEISARVAKIQTPEAKIKDKNDWFMELPEENSEEAAKTANSKIEGSATKVTKGAKRTKPTSSKKKGSSSSTNTQSSSGAAHESLPQPPKVIEALIPKTQAKKLKKVGAKNVQSESKDKVKSKEKVNKKQEVSNAVEFD